jgi:tRNA pseudouridine55 synthase
MGTGVLLVGVNRATRLLGHLTLTEKSYDATVRLGASTTTDDAEGETLSTRSVQHLTEDDVRSAAGRFVGHLQQRPSSVSAIKVDGRRSYARVRAGEQVDLPARSVTVHELLVTDVRRDERAGFVDVDVSVRCSSGTYIRALARDLGRATGSAAHVAVLRRVRSGAFAVDDAVPLDVLQAGGAALRPPLDALRGMPVESLDDAQLARLVRGMPVEATIAGDRAALVDAAGSLAGVAARAGECWQPRVVLRDG